MTTDFSLMDVMGNFTGMPSAVAPDEVTTATSQISPGAEANRGYINPKYALKTTPAVPQEPATPTAVSPQYNANIAQMESGNRPGIGFHAPGKSTAYGPYGTTAAGWQDARKLNPNLPEDITKATPEQLTAGQDAYTQQNAKYLQSYGVPVNENTLAAAHLLGAKGLSDFQKTGYISPQAAAANGGEENLRRIVEARLGGQAAPASGAVPPETRTAINPETGETYQQLVPSAEAATTSTAVTPEQAAQQPTPEAYAGQGIRVGGQTAESLKQQQNQTAILNSNSQENIAKLAFSIDTPKDIQRAALDKLHGTMAVEDGMRKAKAVAESLGQNPTPQALNKAMNDKSTGSYFKVLLYQALGWVSKAKEELNKIDPAVTYSGVTVGDNNYSVKYNKDTGEVMSAWDNQGQMITDPKKLGEIAAGAVNPQTAKSFLMPQTSGSPVTKTINGKLVNGIQIYDPVRKSFYVQYGNQRDTNPEGWTSATQNVEQQATLNKQKAQIDLWKKFQTASTEAKFKYIEDTNKALVAKDGANAQLITPDEMGLQTPALPAVAGGTQAAPVAPPGGTQAAPVVPGTPAATGQIPAMPPTTAPTTAPATAGARPTLQGIQEEEAKKKQQREIEAANAKKLGESNIDYSNTLAKDRQNSLAQTSTINRIQTAIDKHPEFWGIVSGSPGWNAFVNAQSNEDKQKSLQKLYTELNIPENKRAEFDAVANDYRNLQVSTITNSGMSASQLNTEGESQRVIGQIGTMGDRPAAAKAAMEFYKGKIEYNDAKARAWTAARKNNPNLDRLEFETNFDDTKGKEIYDRISANVNKIRDDAMKKASGGAASSNPKEGQTATSASGKPIVWRNNRWEYQ